MANSKLKALSPCYGDPIISSKDCSLPQIQPHQHAVISLLLLDQNDRILVISESKEAFLEDYVTLPYKYVRKPVHAFHLLMHRSKNLLRASEKQIQVLNLRPIIQTFGTVRKDRFLKETLSERAYHEMGLSALCQPVLIKMMIFVATFKGLFPIDWTTSSETKVQISSVPINDIWMIPNSRFRRGIRTAIKSWKLTQPSQSFEDWTCAEKTFFTNIWEVVKNKNSGLFNFVPQVKTYCIYRPHSNGSSLTVSTMHLVGRKVTLHRTPIWMGLIIISQSMKVTWLRKMNEKGEISVYLPQTKIGFYESDLDAISRLREIMKIQRNYVKQQEILPPVFCYNPNKNRNELMSYCVATLNCIVNCGNRAIQLNAFEIKKAITNSRLVEIILESITKAANYDWQ